MDATRRGSVVVLTGAGISADSGLATFRGAGGLWEGRRVEDVATPAAWARDPESVWRFYQLRRASLGKVEPNEAHRALARFEASLEGSGTEFLLVTQNVDDLHERAASRPVHMHGELAQLACEGCGFEVRDFEHLAPEEFVACARCSRRMRPAVVWFGEVPRQLERIVAALERCTHFVAIGTSGLVYPAAGMLALAREGGARTIVTGLEPPDNLTLADEFVVGRAAEVVGALLQRIGRELES